MQAFIIASELSIAITFADLAPRRIDKEDAPSEQPIS